MASITSLMGGTSGTNGLYGNRNVISGLASGMDTEAMIENAISGYNMKISNLQQDYTMLEWQQSAMRSIISKMNNFTNKYLSYTSSTNLLSQSFFNNAVSIKSMGEHASKVTATGKSTSTVEVKGVKQLATAASYAVDRIGSRNDQTTIKGEKVELGDKHKVSNVSGSLRIGYGDKTFTVKLAEDELVANGQELADKLNEKLAEQDMALSDGQTVKVSERVWFEYDSAADTISVKGGAGNHTWLKGATGKIAETLDITTKSTKYDESATSFSLEPKDPGKGLIDDTQTNAEYLASQKITFKLDGDSRSFQLTAEEAASVDKIQAALQQKLDDAYGTDKITVGVENGGLTFKPADGSSLSISNGQAMGLASATETSYISTGRTLGSVLAEQDFESLKDNRIKAADVSGYTDKVVDNVTYKVDSKGNQYKEDGGEWYQVDSKGDYLYDFTINGKSAGKFSKNSTIQQVMDGVNESAAGVTVTYSQTTNHFMFTSKTTGEASKVEMGEGLAETMFGNGGTHKSGQDAIVTLSVNGMELTDKKYTTNSFDVDGLNIKLNGTFNYQTDNRVEVADGVYEAATSEDGISYNINGIELNFKYVNDKGEYVDENGRTYAELFAEKGLSVSQMQGMSTTGDFMYRDASGAKITDPVRQTGGKLVDDAEAVTFQTESDTETIVTAIRDMVKDYNEMATEIKKAYSTMPQYNSKGDRYKPLTEEDQADMSESAIKNYEEKAKQGILFGDRDLNGLYTGLTNAINSMGSALKSVGLEVTYSEGTTTLTLDEAKLKSALETDPDRVRDAFAGDGVKEGALKKMSTTLERYGKVTGATKGILVDKAGTPLSATSLLSNQMLKEMDTLQEQIDKWQEKMADQVDYYTSKFTALEQLILDMNSQSSALMGLMGGY